MNKLNRTGRRIGDTWRYPVRGRATADRDNFPTHRLMFWCFSVVNRSSCCLDLHRFFFFICLHLSNWQDTKIKWSEWSDILGISYFFIFLNSNLCWPAALKKWVVLLKVRPMIWKDSDGLFSSSFQPTTDRHSQVPTASLFQVSLILVILVVII